MSMIASLFKDRYRPPFGSKLWAKYWAKRILLLPSMIAVEVSSRRYKRCCAGFGDRTVVSPSKIGPRLGRLSIGNDCAIGRVVIQLEDRVVIGNCVVISDGCRFLTGTHDIHSPRWEAVSKPIVVNDYAWIATGATILPGVTIGRGAVVGAGAVVFRSIEPLAVVMGNPARQIAWRRIDDFSYRPSESSALIEAWLGPVGGANGSPEKCPR
jgi:acetyltransferase-like isoleucine patch superfamily enzyme